MNVKQSLSQKVEKKNAREKKSSTEIRVNRYSSFNNPNVYKIKRTASASASASKRKRRKDDNIIIIVKVKQKQRQTNGYKKRGTKETFIQTN